MPYFHDKAFWRQSGTDTTLGTKNSEGLYTSVLPFAVYLG